MNLDKKGLYQLQQLPGMPSFARPPPPVAAALLSYPSPHVLLVTLNRPEQLNAVTRAMHAQLHRLWAWFDAEPSLRCAVLTGRGRAFSAGADLREWNDRNAAGAAGGGDGDGNGNGNAAGWAEGGFGGLSNRRGKKPVVAAVNGLCLGGALEMVLNADLVVASADATFGLPEARIGVVAIAGALPRLTRTVGRQRASEMALLGRTYPAATLRDWGVVNTVVAGGGGGGAAAVDEALRWAAAVAANSPDSVVVTREGLLGGWEAEDPAASTRRVGEGIYRRMDGGENMREGVASFIEKRKPVWKDSKL